MRDQAVDEVRISDLEARCSYMRYWASTDESWVCHQPATSLVLVPDALRQGGKPKLRCDDHKGMLNSLERGTIVEAMPRSLMEG